MSVCVCVCVCVCGGGGGGGGGHAHVCAGICHVPTGTCRKKWLKSIQAYTCTCTWTTLYSQPLHIVSGYMKYMYMHVHVHVILHSQATTFVLHYNHFPW